MNDFVDNQEINTLRNLLQRGFVPSPLLFAGSEGLGKKYWARNFALDIVNKFSKHSISSCENHPDIFLLSPRGKVAIHTIESIREYCLEIYSKPFLSSKKVIIIDDADKIQDVGSNALLKSLEDPPEEVVIIMTTSSRENILPTVLSRMFTINFRPMHRDVFVDFIKSKYSLDGGKLRIISNICDGAIGRIKTFLEDNFVDILATLVEFLSKCGEFHYPYLKDMADDIDEYFTALKKRLSSATNVGGELSAMQKDDLEKILDGKISSEVMKRIEAMFNVIKCWYRDLLFYKMTSGVPLFNDENLIQQRLTVVGDVVKMDIVENICKQAMEGIAKSIKISTAVEYFFIDVVYLSKRGSFFTVY